MGRPRGLAVGTCSEVPRCAHCGEPLPARPRPESSDWGDWRCTACGAGHCQDCGAPLDLSGDCQRYADDKAEQAARAALRPWWGARDDAERDRPADVEEAGPAAAPANDCEVA